MVQRWVIGVQNAHQVSCVDWLEFAAVRIERSANDDFADELDKLTALIKAYDVEKGDQVWISYYPGYGLNVNLVGKRAEFIKGTKFGKAVWDIYLGPKNVGENVKKALVSRL